MLPAIKLSDAGYTEYLYGTAELTSPVYTAGILACYERPVMKELQIFVRYDRANSVGPARGNRDLCVLGLTLV
jgi:hypothetical protein